ncbi:MAG: NAD-dependent epimerase/dehydratase family protein [bacterium]|nr:NAD-dependent epimerase/dehydratase family protein [bacterium]
MLDLSAWAGRRVLVTGGSGFIGRQVIAQGAVAGVELVNISGSGKTVEGAQTLPLDLRHHEQVIEQVRTVKPDAILHLAAGGVSYGTSSLSALIQINVLGLEALLQAADSLPTPPPVVIAGSWFEYSPSGRALHESDPTEPVSAYSVTKVAANAIARHYAGRVPITVLRLFAVYGVGEQLPRLFPSVIDATLRGVPVEMTGCEQVRDYVSVTDAAEAFWRALKTPAAAGAPMRILNVGTGQPTPLKRLVLLLADLLRDRGYTPDLRFGVKPYRADENMYGVADVSMLQSVLGWLPSTDYRTGMQALIAFTVHEQRT